MAFRLAYLHLTLAHSKAQGKGHVHFNNDNKKIGLTLLLSSNMKLHMGFRLPFLDLTLFHFKGLIKAVHILIVNISKIVIGQILLLPKNVISHVDFRLAYLDLTFGLF